MKTRFAPSPTGALHIGGVRTALFSYLLAHQQQGHYVLRIEDTDLERSEQAHVDVILEGMAWLGLHSDEPVVFQTQRLDRYKQIADQLLASGHAYRCACSKERLEKMREDQLADKLKTRYDGHCRGLSIQADVPHVVRFRTPETGAVSFIDAVRGTITVSNEELDDLVLVRQDGIPTYNFSVVIDDHDMDITHVVRGDDHINNTPRQLHLYDALGWKPPVFAHLPMILGPDGKRLSKRHGATDVLAYRSMGYLPEAILNYLVRLGWSHGDQEIFSMEEMTQFFDLAHISHAPAAMNIEKLNWLNQHYMRERAPEELADLVKPYWSAMGIAISQGPDPVHLMSLMVERAHTLRELAEKAAFFYTLTGYEEEAKAKLTQPGAAEALSRAEAAFSSLEIWSVDAIKGALQGICEAMGVKMGQVGPPIRVATTGTLHSPSLDQTLYLLGCDVVCKRLRQAQENTSKFA